MQRVAALVGDGRHSNVVISHFANG